jgi:26S proteasome non-ATPase regulatory subunit 10
LNKSHEALLAALIQQDVQQTVALLKKYPGLINASADEHGNTLLHLTAGAGYEDIVLKLLGCNAEVDARNALGMTPLMYAALNGRAYMVKLLVTKGAQINVSTPQGFTALHFAVNSGHEEVVRELLAHGAEVNIQDNRGMTPLDHIEVGSNAKIREMLVAKGARGQSL